MAQLTESLRRLHAAIESGDGEEEDLMKMLGYTGVR